MLGLRRGSESEQGLNSEASVPECVWDATNVGCLLSLGGSQLPRSSLSVSF